ncbi:MAG: hypothetical protein FJ128_02850 [Deltaproteobacteria bacterium]|nr:hypothetical protein [Deltaproteobacteria bacterium]
MSMWFYDEAGEMAEYRLVKQKVQAVEREYLELRVVHREASQALTENPEDPNLQAKVRYLEKRLRHLEEHNPWLTWETPVEVALFSPPHG